MEVAGRLILTYLRAIPVDGRIHGPPHHSHLQPSSDCLDIHSPLRLPVCPGTAYTQHILLPTPANHCARPAPRYPAISRSPPARCATPDSLPDSLADSLIDWRAPCLLARDTLPRLRPGAPCSSGNGCGRFMASLRLTRL